MSKPVILTGLRANNELHIGNYFGALLPLVDQIEKNKGKYQVNLFVPDLHSITTPIEYTKLQSQIMQNLKVFVAAGLPLDDKNVHIYRQSYISAHSELTWILDCFTGFGEMRRMTQFKEKSESQLELEIFLKQQFRKNYFKGVEDVLGKPKDLLERIKRDASFKKEFEKAFEAHIKTVNFSEFFKEPEATVGLFNYPVMMAADILLYGAEYVPVGDDQTQHLEFTRDIAQRINNKFGEIFVIPKPVAEQHKFFAKDQGLRIKDLASPDKKMSKSAESDKGVIFLQDSPDEAKKKIMSATTDSLNQVKYDLDNQPGVSNLIEIYGLIKGKSAKEAEAEFAGETQYGSFKQKIADEVAGFLQDFQAKLASVSEHDVSGKLKDSEEEMNKQANETLIKVQKSVGLR